MRGSGRSPVSRTGFVSAALVFAALVSGGALATPAVGAGGTVTIGIDATVDAAGNTTLLVTAPGCDVSTPANFPEIAVQSRNSVTGEIGEGAVAVGGFTTPGQGSVVIPAGTPVNSFLLTVSCNDGTLRGQLPFTLTAPVAAPVTEPAAPVAAPASFTG